MIVLLIFGAKRIPEIARSLGSGAREFRDGIAGNDAPDDAPPPAERVDRRDKDRDTTG